MLNAEIVTGFGDESVYDFVSSSDNSLIYSTPHFLTLIGKHLDAEPYWILAKRSGAIVGAMPILVKDGPLGKVVNSLPFFGSNGGIISRDFDFEASTLILSTLEEFIVNIKSCSCTIIPNPLLGQTDFYESMFEHDLCDERIGQFTFNSKIKNKDMLISSFHSPRPRNIRRALKAGIKVRKSQSLNDLAFLFETHHKNMKSIGGLPKEKTFFDSIPSVIPTTNWSIYISELNGVSAAGLLVFHYKRTIEYFTPVVDHKFKSEQPLALAVLEAMYEGLQKGYTTWNWGATWLSQQGVYDFKKRWNTTDVKYQYFTRVLNREVFDTSEEQLLAWYKGFYVVPFKDLKVSKMPQA